MKPSITCIIVISILIICLCAVIPLFGVCWVKPKTYCNTSDRFTREPIVAYYINLDHRTDRKERMEKEFKGLPLDLRRMPAVLSKVHGGIGCTKSHIKVLEEAMRLNLPHVLVLEDDVTFKEGVDWSKVLATLNCIDGNEDWDVILLGGNISLSGPRGPSYVQICSSQDSHSYIVNRHYYSKLLQNFKTSSRLLEASDLSAKSYAKFATDQWWKRLQRKDQWFCVWPPRITQISGFSDIDKKMKKS